MVRIIKLSKLEDAIEFVRQKNAVLMLTLGMIALLLMPNQ